MDAHEPEVAVDSQDVAGPNDFDDVVNIVVIG